MLLLWQWLMMVSEWQDLGIILSEKMQVIKKTGILEFINTDIKIADVGV